MPTLVSVLNRFAGRMLPGCIEHPAIAKGAGFGAALRRPREPNVVVDHRRAIRCRRGGPYVSTQYVDTGRGWPEAKQVAEPTRLSQHTPSEVLLRSAATRESAVHFPGDAHNPAFDLSGGCPPGLDRALATARSSSQLIFGNLLWRVPIVAIYRAKTRAERRGSSPGRHRWSTGSETHETPSLARPCRRPPH